MKGDCNEIVAKYCKDSNLLENISENLPTQSDSPLPKECQNIDLDNPDYNLCFAWINKNLIAYTLFPQITKIKSIQKLITDSEKDGVKSLRYLQDDDNLKIVVTDASSRDTIALIPEYQYKLNDKDVVIDGASTDKIVVEQNVIEIKKLVRNKNY